MNIAGIIFESLLKTGGYEIFTYNLFKTLARRGNTVTLYLPDREVARHKDFYRHLPFAVRPLIPRTHFFLKHAPGLLQRHLALQQRSNRYDVWQLMGAWPEGSSALRIPAPKVLRCYGEDIQVSTELGYGIRRIPALDHEVRKTLAHMDRVVAMTPSMADLLLDLDVKPANIARIPNAIDIKRFQAQRNRKAIRSHYNLAPNDFVLLTIGRNHPKKGFDLIPKFAARLRKTGRRFVWLLVGADTEKLLPELRAAGLAEEVRPMRPISGSANPDNAARLELPTDELLDIYAMSDLFVFPSRLEGFSRVILESLAAGLPVVTTDAPGCGETFVNGKQGFVSPIEHIDDMVGNVLRLMDDPDLLARLSTSARDYARNFDWDIVAEAYENQYRQLLKYA